MKPEPAPGSRVGDYVLEEVLGRGGTATVYLARGRQGEKVAIKIYRLREGMGGAGLGDAARIWREIQTVQGLTHPRLVEIKGFGWDPVPHLVMERVVGMTLRAWLRTHPPDTAQRVVLLDVFDAVAYAHRRNVLHRDLKPENLFVRHDGTGAVADFGTAQVIDAPRLTTTGRVQGTPGYVSPEQLRGERASAASDQYALGVLVFECLAGHGPFAAETALAAMYQQLTGSAPSLRATRADLPPALDLCVARMLSADPSARFESVAAAAACLAEAWSVDTADSSELT